ncbi:extracellular solute-binding protein [Paenibacillus sp. J2TS4]|uniref:extracellular solute-binding protein n=1 Tax=Paenibacillus sp. J2TS4 TaxID=2807194 RepID=UPI001B1BDAB9|nr:extracellular solute-binding protein [Paenibacillus sp. J2TS4]GIP36373.1 hypothetical protein J2TS4_55830 [Paenibacillus sp. J2TS4]
MTRKKSLIVLFIILGLSILLISKVMGPGGSPRAGSNFGKDTFAKTSDGLADNEERLIHLAVCMKPEEYEALKQWTEQYSAAKTGIKVELTNLPLNEAYDILKKASQLGEAPDLMLLNNDWVNEFAALGYLQPMDEWLSNDQQAQRLPELMDQVKWNGYLWGIPKDVDPYILAWNKQKAEELQVDHAPLTAEELLQWNEKFMNPEEKQYGVYYHPDDPYSLLSLLSALGVPFSEGVNPLAKLDDPETMHSLESFFNPKEKSWDPKVFQTNFPLPTKDWDPWEQLSSGNIAAMITTISDYKLHENDKIALSALPMVTEGAGQTGTWLKGRSYAISSRAGQEEAVIELLQELTSLGTEMKLWGEAKTLPAYVSAFMTEELRNDPSFKSYTWLVEQGYMLPVQIDSAKKLHALAAEMEALRQGEQDFSAFTDKAASLWKKE